MQTVIIGPLGRWCFSPCGSGRRHGWGWAECVGGDSHLEPAMKVRLVVDGSGEGDFVAGLRALESEGGVWF